MAQGWSQGAPHDEVELLPLSDGGPGFLDVLSRALGGTTVATTVSDPLGREVPAAVLVVERDGRRTAYVEASQASGLHLLGADERDPGLTSTWGVGQLLDVAVEQGATKVVVGVGGSGTNDAGAGHAGRARGRAGVGAGARRPRPRLGHRRRAAAGSPTSSRGWPGSRSWSPPTTTPRCSACRAPARSRRRARAPRPSWPRPSRGPWAASPTCWAARCPRRPSSCSAGCRAGSTARRAPVPLVGSATACSRSVRAGSAGSPRCCASAASASPRPAATSSSPAPGGSTGARLRGSVVAGVAAADPRDRAPDRARRGGVPRRPARDDDPGPRRAPTPWPTAAAEVEAMVGRPGHAPWPPARRAWRAPGRPAARVDRHPGRTAW